MKTGIWRCCFQIKGDKQMMRRNILSEGEEVPQKKRKKRKDYDFSGLVTDWHEKAAAQYKGKNLKELSPLFKEIFLYYQEEGAEIPDKSDFLSLCKETLSKFKPEKEIGFYFYLKSAIEDRYNLFDKRFYFFDREEHAFRLYISEEDESRRNVIFERFLHQPLVNMIDGVLRGFGFSASDLGYSDLKKTILVELILKFPGFDVSKGTKAYSYLTKIIIRIVINIIRQDKKNNAMVDNYHDIYNYFSDDKKTAYEMDISSDETHDILEELAQVIENYIEKNRFEPFMNECDLIIGECLIAVLRNWDFIYQGEEEISKKRIKKGISHVLQEMTSYDLKKITESLAHYKNVYWKYKKEKNMKDYDSFEGMFLM
jgi:hypothetical protein